MNHPTCGTGVIYANTGQFGATHAVVVRTSRIKLQAGCETDKPLQIVNCSGETVCYVIVNDNRAILDFYGVVRSTGVAFKQRDPLEEGFCPSRALWVNAADNHLYFGSTNLSDKRPGPPGRNGQVGAQGPPGPRGNAGTTGGTGYAGDTGMTGKDGGVGPVGMRGAAGAAGVVGNTGPVGPDGAPGPPGQNGFLIEQPLLFMGDIGHEVTVDEENEFLLLGSDTADIMNRQSLHAVTFLADQTIRITYRVLVTGIPSGSFSEFTTDLVLEYESKQYVLQSILLSAQNNTRIECTIVSSIRPSDNTTVSIYSSAQCITSAPLTSVSYVQCNPVDTLVPRTAQYWPAAQFRLIASTTQNMTMCLYPSQVYLYGPRSEVFLFHRLYTDSASNTESIEVIGVGIQKVTLIDGDSLNASGGGSLASVQLLRPGHSLRLMYDGVVENNNITDPTPNNVIFRVILTDNNIAEVPFTIPKETANYINFSALITLVALAPLRVLVQVTGCYGNSASSQLIRCEPRPTSITEPFSAFKLECELASGGYTIRQYPCHLYQSE